MPISGVITRGSGAYIIYSWSEFKKYIDGTYSVLSYYFQTFSSYYLVITEAFGGFAYECKVIRDNGADHLDWENNFRDLEPRLPEEAHDNALTTLYEILDNYIYMGYAKPGTLTSAPYWTIKRIALVNGLPTERKSTEIYNATWDDRATETYY